MLHTILARFFRILIVATIVAIIDDKCQINFKP